MGKTHPIIFGVEPVKAILDGRKTMTRRVIIPQPKPCRHKEIFAEEESGYNAPPVWQGQIIDWKGYKYEGRQGWFCYICGNGLKHIDEWSAHGIICPYGQVGDRLWVREAFCQVCYKKDGIEDVCYKEDCIRHETISSETTTTTCKQKWTPSIFMPRWASRLILEITGVRVERLQEITEEDAKLEGANPFLVDKLSGGKHYRMLKTYHHECYPLVSHADEGEEVVFECPNMGFARLHHTQWQEKQDPVFRIPSQEVFEYVGALEPNYKNGFRILWDSLNAKRGYGWDKNPWVWVIKFDNIGVRVK